MKNNCNNTDCQNQGTLCYKCNGVSFYKMPKQSNIKLKKSKRAGSSLERQSVYAHLQNNSGAGYRKGDVETNNTLIECKSTGKNCITIHREWLEENSQHASKYGKMPVLNIQFGGDQQIYSIVKTEDLEQLLILLED